MTSGIITSHLDLIGFAIVHLTLSLYALYLRNSNLSCCATVIVEFTIAV